MAFNGLNIEIEADSSSSDENKNVSVESKNTPAFSDLMKRFELLKEKRTRLKTRREKKSLKRLNERIIKSETNAKTETFDKPELTDVYLEPNDEEKTELKSYEIEIDKAIRGGDFELAESISEQLFKHEQKIKADRVRTASKSKSLKREKKSPFWRFDPKQRWETKSNM